MRLLAFLLALFTAGPAFASEIMVIDPYARAARPGAPTGAVFMTLHNMGTTGDRLVGATTPAAEITQIHTHIDEDGVMKMREVKDGIPLAAGAMHAFERGGDHVMLMGLTQDLMDGDTLSLTLIFEQAGEVEIQVPVDSKRGQGTKSHDH